MSDRSIHHSTENVFEYNIKNENCRKLSEEQPVMNLPNKMIAFKLHSKIGKISTDPEYNDDSTTDGDQVNVLSIKNELEEFVSYRNSQIFLYDDNSPDDIYNGDISKTIKRESVEESESLGHSSSIPKVTVKLLRCTEIKDSFTNWQNVTSNESEFHCAQCKFVSTERHLLVEHLKSHGFIDYEQKCFSCDVCNFRTKSKYSLRVHKRIHDAFRSKVYVCDECNYATDYKSCLTRHKKMHALKASGSTSKQFKCDLCSYSTFYKSNLVCHIRTHETIYENRPYACGQCSYRAKQLCAMREHLLTHEPNKERIFQCASCTYRTHYKPYLKKHSRMVHDPDRVKHFACSLCEYRADSRISIQNHERTHDPNREKPFQCNTCSFRTDAKKTLNTHLRTHVINRVRPLACDFCPYRTDNRSYLLRHLETHNPNRLRPFACDYCDYRTVERRMVDLHVRRIHSTKKVNPSKISKNKLEEDSKRHFNSN